MKIYFLLTLFFLATTTFSKIGAMTNLETGPGTVDLFETASDDSSNQDNEGDHLSDSIEKLNGFDPLDASSPEKTVQKLNLAGTDTTSNTLSKIVSRYANITSLDISKMRVSEISSVAGLIQLERFSARDLTGENCVIDLAVLPKSVKIISPYRNKFKNISALS